jgi:two-component system phosphate regulon sensor histidine kinase PhoR
MRLSLRRKIILLSLSLLFFVTVSASFFSTYEMQKYYKTRVFQQLKSQLEELEYLLVYTDLGKTPDDVDYESLVEYARTSAFRLTLIDSTGTVIFDSNVPQDSLAYVENHINRPEIQNALHKGTIGSHQRASATIHESMFYAAKRLDFAPQHPFFAHVKFIRLAIPLKEIETVLSAVRWKIFGGGGFALLIMAAVSYWIAKRVTKPIHSLTQAAELVKKGNVNAHFDVQTRDEIGDLAILLNQMLDKLREDLVQMRKLEKMRSQFLGNVSHELRTPIFAVQGYLETILNEKGFKPKKARIFIRKAYKQSERLNNLLTDLIDISRIESGEMKMSFNEFGVHDWLSKLVSDLEPTANRENVKLTLSPRTAVEDITVIGDQDRLNQVIINLVENAIKYNRPGGRVDVGYAKLDHSLRIHVSDTGSGIEPEHLSRLFERFYRVDKERSRAVGGTGLGLAIVKHIVEAHKSKIKVESEVGVGSTFSFCLRRKE